MYSISILQSRRTVVTTVAAAISFCAQALEFSAVLLSTACLVLETPACLPAQTLPPLRNNQPGRG